MASVFRRAGRAGCTTLACVLMAAPAWAGGTSTGDTAPFELGVAQDLPDAELAQAQASDGVVTERTERTSTESDESSLPVSVGLAYSLYSDYIFRFANYSEHAREGREKPNHQLAADIGFDLGDFGSITYGAWFEWYGDQDRLLESQGGQNCQEIDHTIEWGYTIDAIKSDIAIGVAWYTIMNDKAANTFEWYGSISHNDAWLWQWLLPDNEDGVLNPSFFMAHDVDALGGVWMEFSISHGFELFEHFTLTPGWLVAVDACYYEDNTARFAGDQWSLVGEYDLGAAMHLPDRAGSLTVAGELYYNNAWSGLRHAGIADDELWGGITVGWNWGG